MLWRYEVSGLSVAPLFRLTTRGSASPGTAHRGLAAAVGSLFLTAVPNEGTAHSGAAGVRVFELGVSRAIYGQWHDDER